MAQDSIFQMLLETSGLVGAHLYMQGKEGGEVEGCLFIKNKTDGAVVWSLRLPKHINGNFTVGFPTDVRQSVIAWGQRWDTADLDSLAGRPLPGQSGGQFRVAPGQVHLQEAERGDGASGHAHQGRGQGLPQQRGLPLDRPKGARPPCQLSPGMSPEKERKMRSLVDLKIFAKTDPQRAEVSFIFTFSQEKGNLRFMYVFI